jgi:alpha-mannosidase
MYFQDLGWAAKPRVSASYIRYVTWSEYIREIGDKPSKQWRFTPEDILTTLPWGEKTLQAVAQQVRSAENRILAAEKLAAMACLEKGSPWPAAQLRAAWDSLLWAQGHDAWITATTRTGRQAWAFQVASGTLASEDAADAIIAESARALSTGAPSTEPQPLGPQWIRVMNTLGVERHDLAELSIATDRGTRSLRLSDATGKEIVCQIAPSRVYSSGPAPAGQNRQGAGARTLSPNESINAATILFRAETPALGYTSYRVDPIYDGSVSPARQGVEVKAEPAGAVVMENNLYRLRLDPARGGAITSLVAKDSGKEFCDPSATRLFNEYAGYFIAQKQWRSSVEQPARITILESGPLRGRVRISGQVGGCPFQTTLTLADGERRIDANVRITFEQDTWIGDPWDIKPEDRRSEPRRSQNDGRWKLQAFFPVSLRNQAVYKNAAYDVCRSRNADTFFQRWDEIKHNIIVNWVDLIDERDKHGLAVLSDHTTAYTHGPDHPLALVLGWGWEGGFWWGKCPLRGVQQASYSLIPHAGLWDEARLSAENARWCEPLLTEIMDGQPKKGDETNSLVRVSGGGIEVPTVLIDGHDMLIRLFNAEGDDAERTISLKFKPSRVDVVALDGRRLRQLDVRQSADGRHEVKLALPRFGLRTLRCQTT